MRGVSVRPTSIRITFTLDGKQRHETVMVNGAALAPTPPNLKYAARLAAEIRDRVKHGTFSMAEYFPASGAGAAQVTVAAQLDAWLKAQRITKSTRNGYDSVVKFWKLHLGDKPLRAVKHSDIPTVLNTQPGLSGKTINNRVSVLREAFNMAVLDNLLTANPVANVKSATWQRRPVDPFSADEVELILADMAEHHPPQVVNYVTAKFFTGLRTGESFALSWPNVDLADGHIVVRETLTAGEQKASTKTNTARTVMLNSRALGALERQKQHSYLAGKHVFLDPRNGAAWTGEPRFRFYWLATLKRLKMRHRPPYTTRHTYATMMLMAGMRPAFCAGQMGHSIEIFLRTYAKWIPGAGDKAEMAKLEQSIKKVGLAELG